MLDLSEFRVQAFSTAEATAAATGTVDPPLHLTPSGLRGDL